MRALGHGRQLPIVATAIALVASGCLPAAVTPEGRDVTALYSGFLVVAAIVALVVLVPATIALVRFRRRAGTTTEPRQREGHAALEIAWTVIPALTVVGLFIATLLVLVRVDKPASSAGVEIDVTAYRWGWTFAYPREGVTVDGIGEPGPEVAVPVGEPITIRLTSADVIHSFYVPVFLFKRDVNPGRENVFEFSVDTAGAYRGQCAEFCGLYHARMPFSVLAMDRPAYDAWLASTKTAAASAVPVPRAAAAGAGAP